MSFHYSSLNDRRLRAAGDRLSVTGPPRKSPPLPPFRFPLVIRPLPATSVLVRREYATISGGDADSLLPLLMVVAIYDARRRAPRADKGTTNERDTPTATSDIPGGRRHSRCGGQRACQLAPHSSHSASDARRDRADTHGDDWPHPAPQRPPLTAASHAGRFA